VTDHRAMRCKRRSVTCDPSHPSQKYEGTGCGESTSAASMQSCPCFDLQQQQQQQVLVALQLPNREPLHSRSSVYWCYCIELTTAIAAQHG
jgi:hypothetical protein